MLSLITTANNAIVFFGDSILSTFNTADSPHTTTWLHMLSRNPTYGYNGDIFAEAYAGRILQHDTANPTTGLIDNTKVTALATKLAAYDAQKYWFQIGVNDYGFANVLLAPPFSVMSLANFTEQYAALVDKLHELKPTAKIFIQCIGPDFYEGPNKESVDPDDPDIATGPTANDYRAAQKNIALGVVASGPNAGTLRTTFCEYVDFYGVAGSAFAGVYGETGIENPTDASGPMIRSDIFNIYSKDGIHPNTLGQIKYADAVVSRSTLLVAPVPQPLSVNTVKMPGNIVSTTLPSVVIGEAYNVQFNTINGTFPYTYTIASGGFPAGVSMNSAGHITGTTSATLGTSYNVVIDIVDSTTPTAKTIQKTYSGVVTDTASGLPETTDALSIGSLVNSNMYDIEWTTPTLGVSSAGTSTYPVGSALVNVARVGDVFATTTPPAHASLKCFFRAPKVGSGEVNGTFSFVARGTGVLTIATFEISNWAGNINRTNAKVTLNSTFTTHSVPIKAYNNEEHIICFIFNDGAGNIATNVEFERNAKLNFSTNPYGLTGDYKRYGATLTSLMGNVDVGWALNNSSWGGKWDYNNGNAGLNNCYKYVEHSSYARLKFLTNAPNIVLEYVREIESSGIVLDQFGVFENNDQADHALNVKAQELIDKPGGGGNTKVCYFNQPLTLTGSTDKTIEVVAPGQTQQTNGAGTYVHCDLARVGGFIRAVYIPEGYSFSPITVPHPDSVMIIGDSISSGSNVSSHPTKNTWHQRIRRYYSTFGYNGDVFDCSNGNRMFSENIDTAPRRTDFANRLALLGIKKFWFQIGVNDWYGSLGNNLVGRPSYNATQYFGFYAAFLDAFHAAMPDAKAYVTNLIPTNQEANVASWRSNYPALATGRPWVEIVDWSAVASGTTTSGIWSIPETGTYLADGVHPNDAGSIRLAQGMGQRSPNFLIPLTLNIAPTGTVFTVIKNSGVFSQTFTASNGTPPYVFSATGLPGWLSINPTTGVLSGTAPSIAASTVNFSVSVTDASPNVVTNTGYSMTVLDAPVITVNPTTLPNGTNTQAYSQTITATGGSGYVFTSTALPAGLTLNSSAGVLSATNLSAAVGSYSFTITATATGGYVGSRSYTFVVDAYVQVLTMTVEKRSSDNHILVKCTLNQAYANNPSNNLYIDIGLYGQTSLANANANCNAGSGNTFNYVQVNVPQGATSGTADAGVLSGANTHYNVNVVGTNISSMDGLPITPARPFWTCALVPTII